MITRIPLIDADSQTAQSMILRRELVPCASVEIEHLSEGNVWLTLRDKDKLIIRTMSLCPQKGSK